MTHTLDFPATQFELATLQVTIDGRPHEVSLRHYRHVPYVARPVDTEYQSLDLRVPVAMDGVPYDAADAPILFNITVGGYLSVSNLHDRPKRRPPNPAIQHTHRPGPQLLTGHTREQRNALALAAGYVLVTPGTRGRDNQAADGHYYGKAPAAIVDLKAAVRYLRHNAGSLPGNTARIISCGGSAGGALSALLGTSGNSPLYADYLEAIGAAEAADDVFATACYAPITDMEHADLSYEWFFGQQTAERGPYDLAISRELAALQGAYQDSLGLQGRHGFGPVSGARLGEYLYGEYLQPAATCFLQALDEATRQTYLEDRPWLAWDGRQARFSLPDLARDIGRGKGAPAFDDFALDTPEVSLFGDAQTAVRTYTDYSLQHLRHDPQARIGEPLATVVRMMNAMYFARTGAAQQAHYWWLRNGTHDKGVDPAVMINLGTCLENRGHEVDTLLYWNGGHCADRNPQDMLDWMNRITGHRPVMGTGH